MSIDIEPRVSGLLRRRKINSGRPEVDRAAEPSTPTPPRLPGRRNPKWIALGIVAICLGGLLSYVIYARVATETAVVAIAETVHRGEVVERGDLTTITLSGDLGVPTVPAAEIDSLIGQRAAYDLVDGAILPAGAISAVLVPGLEHTLVGIRATAGHAPSSYLVAGAAVRLIAVPPSNAEPGFTDAYLGKTFAARVVDQQPGPDAASVLVNVEVPSQQAAVVAVLAAEDRLTIVRDADR